MEIKKSTLFFLIGLYVAGALIFLGTNYFRGEEPRRSIIALEMNYTHDYFTPHVLGRPYFKKPPLHNVIIALFFKIFGENEFAARLVSVLSMMGISLLIYISTKDIVGLEASVFASFAFGLSYIAYFQYGIWAETDMFFSFLVFLSLVLLFKNKIIWGSFVTALALLTKGFPALHYFYFTMILYFALNKEIKRVFSKDVIVGAVIILGIFISWLLIVSKGNIHRIDYVLGFLIYASGSRVESIVHISKVILHLLKFPVSFFLHYLPFSALLLLFFNDHFRRGFKELIESDKEKRKLLIFIIAAFVPNFLVYAILPGGRIRYALVTFAVLSMFLGILYYLLEYNNIFDFRKTFKFLFIGLVLVGVGGFLFDLFFAKGKWLIPALLGVFLSSGGLLFVFRNNESECCVNLIVYFVVFSVASKFIFDATYKNYAYVYYTNYRKKGFEAAKIILQHSPDYVMTTGGNLRFFFYLERDLGFQIHPFSRKKHGIVVTTNRKLVKRVFKEIELPDHLYFIGEK